MKIDHFKGNLIFFFSLDYLRQDVPVGAFPFNTMFCSLSGFKEIITLLNNKQLSTCYVKCICVVSKRFCTSSKIFTYTIDIIFRGKRY